ncbi:MAG: CaiB/BaiF CoA transferase family protein [Micrococcaceae bacterium]
MRRPLAGYTVIDLTTALAGPYATLLLAGLGARVIKVENPASGGDPARNNAPYATPDGLSLSRTSAQDQSLSHLVRSRNKESIVLDLKSDAGRQALLDLCAEADVLVENFSPGVTRRLGIDFETVREVNSTLIYTSISGFGAQATNDRAMDTIIQALSGLMMTSGEPGGEPVRAGVPFADLLAPIYAVLATVVTLLDGERGAAREARHIDVSMLGALTHLVSFEPYEALEELGVPLRTGQFVPRLAPFGSFPAADGWVAICAPLDKFAEALLYAMDDDGHPRRGDYASRDARVRHAQLLHEDIAAWTATLTVDALLDRLTHAGVPVAEVRSPEAAVRDERVREREDIVDVGALSGMTRDTVLGPGIPFTVSGLEVGFDRAARPLGADTATILSELLGYSPDQVATVLGTSHEA